MNIPFNEVRGDLRKEPKESPSSKLISFISNLGKLGEVSLSRGLDGVVTPLSMLR